MAKKLKNLHSISLHINTNINKILMSVLINDCIKYIINFLSWPDYLNCVSASKFFHVLTKTEQLHKYGDCRGIHWCIQRDILTDKVKKSFNNTTMITYIRISCTYDSISVMNFILTSVLA